MQPNDQDPQQPQQPEQPIPQSQPPVDTSMRRTIQPLSSEDDIRNEAQAARPASPAQEDSVGQSTPPIPAPIGESSSERASDSLITEPITPRPLNTTPDLRTSPLPSLPQKSSGRKIISVIIGFIVIAALAVGAYLFFFSGKVATDDLVEQSVRQTTYLRPETWEAVPLGVGIETYSDLGEGKQSVATVTIDESVSSIRYYGNDRPDNYYETIRSQAMQKETVNSIQILFRNGSRDCTSEITFNVEPDTKTANDTVGMALATGTCTREDGTYIVKRRTVIGESDGIFRHITVGASESDWSKNKVTFQAILDSVGQVQADQ